MMKTIFSILLLSLAAATAAEAQSLEAFKQRLVEPDSGARVEIHEAPDAAAAFSAASRSAAEKRHSGWRINLLHQQRAECPLRSRGGEEELLRSHFRA